MRTRASWVVMTVLAFVVVLYAVALLVVPAARAPFLRDRVARVPLAVYAHLSAGAIALAGATDLLQAVVGLETLALSAVKQAEFPLAMRCSAYANSTRSIPVGVPRPARDKRRDRSRAIISEGWSNRVGRRRNARKIRSSATDLDSGYGALRDNAGNDRPGQRIQ